MQAIILAAGKGTRMKELTLTRPKPMLSIAEKNLIEWKLDVLPDEIDEVIIVVGYLKDVIISYFGNEYKGKKITYVEAAPHGTGFAVWQCAHLIKDRFLVLMGDDLYSREAIKNAMKEPLSITAAYTNIPRGGCLETDAERNFIGIDDKKKHVGLINTALYSLTKDIFTFDLVKVPGTEEFGLPHTLVEVGKMYPVKVLETKAWHQATAPEDLNPSGEWLQNFR